MDVEKLEKMAICYWDDESGSYVVKSPLDYFYLGVGDTRETAWESFRLCVKEAQNEDNQPAPNTVPEPPLDIKSTVSISTEVTFNTDRVIATLIGEFGCDTGEALDYLAAHYEASRLAEKP
jgi:hypothetical protein